MNLLVNGCSHTAGDYENDWFRSSKLKRSWASKLGNILNAKKVINLSLGGASNKRIIRTTLEYLINNPKFSGPVIIAWTTHTRNEFTWHHSFFDRTPKGLLGGGVSGTEKKFGHWVLATNPHDGDTQQKSLKDFMTLYYKYSHCYDFEKEIFQQQLIMFESFLKDRGIDYYFFCALDNINFESTYGKQLNNRRWISFGDDQNSCDFLESNGFNKGYCKHFNHDGQLFLAQYLADHIESNSVLVDKYSHRS